MTRFLALTLTIGLLVLLTWRYATQLFDLVDWLDRNRWDWISQYPFAERAA